MGHCSRDLLETPSIVTVDAFSLTITERRNSSPASDRNASGRRGPRTGYALRQLAGRFNILSVPYLFVFDNGQLKQSLPGVQTKHELMMLMAPYI